MKEHNDLIDSLAGQLTPVRRPPSLGLMALGWWFLGIAYVMAITALVGPPRPGVGSQLLAEPRFILETVAGVLAIGAVACAALASAIPGRPLRGWLWLAGIAVALWLGNLVAGLAIPTLEPSMLGKRDHCFSETLLYALPPLVGVLFMVRRLHPLTPVSTGLGAGLAAGLLPAWYMQLSCMYQANHILLHHVLPGLLVVPLGAGLMWWLARRGDRG